MDRFRYRVSIHGLKSLDSNKTAVAGVMVETYGALTTASKLSDEEVPFVDVEAGGSLQLLDELLW